LANTFGSDGDGAVRSADFCIGRRRRYQAPSAFCSMRGGMRLISNGWSARVSLWSFVTTICPASVPRRPGKRWES